jgi:HemY protein
MIRAALALVFLALLAVAVSAVIGQPGSASLEWLGWRLDMTAAAALMLIALAALASTIFWRAVIWTLRAPERARQARLRARRRQADEALARGFTAVAAGDGAEARRWSRRASELVEDTPDLARLLAAQSAEAAGDEAAAEAAYGAMLALPDLAQAGRRGLMQLALARGDRAAALAQAEAAYAAGRASRWAWSALLEARLEAADWQGALELVKSALDRKITPPAVAERTRAALQAALAASLETSGQPDARARALDCALDAAKRQPGFAPGVVMAARLLADDGRTARAEGLIRDAWKLAPHPALGLAYRDLRTDETPAERARRLDALAALNPGCRESRLLRLEAALLTGDVAGARRAVEPLLEEPPATARLCALMARIAFAAAAADEARAWIARAAAAPQEPDWSDLDPEGKAFAYTPADWARLVLTYAETGELVHPRLERRERTISELPDLPVSYQAPTPFLEAAQAGLPLGPLADDPGMGPAYEDDDPPPPAAQPRSPRLGARGRRR